MRGVQGDHPPAGAWGSAPNPAPQRKKPKHSQPKARAVRHFQSILPPAALPGAFFSSEKKRSKRSAFAVCQHRFVWLAA